ncbi:LOW QUALITY PROTEIN: testis-expressed protein 101 [Ctenodactylus gundi]
MWGRSSWVTKDGFMMKRDDFAPQRRASTDLYFVFFPVANNLSCQKGVSVTVEENPGSTFNWTTDEVETCDNGALCQETIVMIKAAGSMTAVLATKGCISDASEAITFIQHSASPGLVAISYNSNSSSVSTTLFCPTCVALDACFSAPSLPCPKGTTRCYQGKLHLFGGGINSSVEVKGCTALVGCKLMSRILKIGPILVKEMCSRQVPSQPRKACDTMDVLPGGRGTTVDQTEDTRLHSQQLPAPNGGIQP